MAVEYTSEGIGNEVWWTLGVFSSAFIGIFVILFLKRSEDNVDIHPQQVILNYIHSEISELFSVFSFSSFLARHS